MEIAVLATQSLIYKTLTALRTAMCLPFLHMRAAWHSMQGQTGMHDLTARPVFPALDMILQCPGRGTTAQMLMVVARPGKTSRFGLFDRYQSFSYSVPLQRQHDADIEPPKSLYWLAQLPTPSASLLKLT